MPEDLIGLNFNAEEFLKLPRAQKAEVCIALAERSQKVGEGSPPNQRLHFVEIASQWLMLAEKIMAE